VLGVLLAAQGQSEIGGDVIKYNKKTDDFVRLTKAAKYRQGQRVVAVSEGERLPGTVQSVEGTEGDFYYRIKLDKPYRHEDVITAEEWQVQPR
jgi:hypothetical protein